MFWGIRGSKTGVFQTKEITCEQCNSNCKLNVAVKANYIHAFFIPIIPVGKSTEASCSSCLRTYKKKELSPELKQEIKEKKKNIKRPVWHYLSSLIALGLIAVFAVFMFISIQKDNKNPLLQGIKEDRAKMDVNPTMEADSIAFQVAEKLDLAINFNDLETSSFEYYTELKPDKILVMVKLNWSSDQEKEVNLAVLEQTGKTVEKYIKEKTSLQEMRYYISVEDNDSYNYYLSTGGDSDAGRFMKGTLLKGFYWEEIQTTEN